MKKLLGIVVLGLLLSSNAYAGCSDKIQFSWYKDGNYAKLKFYNKGGKFVRITHYEIMDRDKDTIREHKARLFVGSNESRTLSVNLWGVVKYAAFADYECQYQKPYEKSVGDRAEDLVDSVKGWFDDD